MIILDNNVAKKRKQSHRIHVVPLLSFLSFFHRAAGLPPRRLNYCFSSFGHRVETDSDDSIDSIRLPHSKVAWFFSVLAATCAVVVGSFPRRRRRWWSLSLVVWFHFDPLRGSLSHFTFDLTQSLQHDDRRPLDELADRSPWESGGRRCRCCRAEAGRGRDEGGWSVRRDMWLV